MSWTRNIRFTCDAAECDVHRVFWPWDLNDLPNARGEFKLPSIDAGRKALRTEGWARRSVRVGSANYVADFCPAHAHRADAEVSRILREYRSRA